VDLQAGQSDAIQEGDRVPSLDTGIPGEDEQGDQESGIRGAEEGFAIEEVIIVVFADESE
jgi:hypothetical protein